MANITLRATKTEPLTYEEMDSNMIELDNLKVDHKEFVEDVYPAQQSQISAVVQNLSNLSDLVNNALGIKNQEIQSLESRQNVQEGKFDGIKNDFTNFLMANIDLVNLHHIISGFEDGATKNQTDTWLTNRTNHHGTQSASTITGLAAVATTGQYSSLSGLPDIPQDYSAKINTIETGATKNQSDASLKSRANHTGTQAASTITGLAAVATTGQYSSLSGLPNFPTLMLESEARTGTADTERTINARVIKSAILHNIPAKMSEQEAIDGTSTVQRTIDAKSLKASININAPLTPIPDKMPLSEANSGTATTQRTIDAATLKATINTNAPIPGNVTTTTNGLMLATDKAKLDGFGTNAYGTKTISADFPSGGVNGDLWYRIVS